MRDGPPMRPESNLWLENPHVNADQTLLLKPLPARTRWALTTLRSLSGRA